MYTQEESLFRENLMLEREATKGAFYTVCSQARDRRIIGSVRKRQLQLPVSPSLIRADASCVLTVLLDPATGMGAVTASSCSCYFSATSILGFITPWAPLA